MRKSVTDCYLNCNVLLQKCNRLLQKCNRLLQFPLFNLAVSTIFLGENMRPKMSDIHKFHANILNVGLGIQSTMAALGAINRDLPRPDAFIFADTGWEREGTYKNLEILKPMAEEAGIPFHVVTAGNIREEALADNGRIELPFFCNPSRYETVAGKRTLLIKDTQKAYRKRQKTLEKNGQTEMFGDITLAEYLEVGLENFDRKVVEGTITDGYMEMDTMMIGRQCTLKYKITPVNKHCRKHYGAHFKTPVGTWLGISTDEWTRMGTSESKAFVLMYPLIDYGMSRQDCRQYLIDHDYPVPVKSSCIGCPFHDDSLWDEMTEAEHTDVSRFERTVNMKIAMDDSLRDLPYFANGVHVHRSKQPIHSSPFKKFEGESESDRDAVCGAAGCFL